MQGRAIVVVVVVDRDASLFLISDSHGFQFMFFIALRLSKVAFSDRLIMSAYR